MIGESVETVLTSLGNMLSGDILLVGMGNSLRADDGIGSEVCSQLKESIPDNVIDTGTVPENYIQVIIKKTPKVILFIDAIDFGAPAGTIGIFDPCQLSESGITTHTLSPRLLSDMIAHSIPVKIYFIGIQPKSTMMGGAMSQEVESASNKLLKRLKHLFTLSKTV